MTLRPTPPVDRPLAAPPADPPVPVPDGAGTPPGDGATALSWAAKRTYATVARGTGAALRTVGVLPDEAPDRDRRVRHWLVSLSRVHDSLALADLDVPWWTYRAIDVVEAWLVARRGTAAVFEYGSGASTLWLAARCAEVTTVEHHAGFAQQMAPALAAHGNVRALTVEPVPASVPAVPSAKPGHAGLDFTGYVDAINRVPGTFDLIVVDGRARQACLARALPRLAAGGIVVFDNSRRSRYRAAIDASGLSERRLAGLTPTLPYPDQTSILSAEPFSACPETPLT